jgi:drug/metabolite transporter (DMT)-like permease
MPQVAIWLPATLLAALLQSWRTAVQQRVRARLSLNAAGLVRYFYGLPVGCLILLCWVMATGATIPPIGSKFVILCLAAGLAQIIGTNLLLMAFGYRNYVVGTAYAKTEAIQGALLSMILLGERLPWLAWVGIGLGVLGVMVLSAADARWRWSDLAQPAALCGLGAGLGFTLTSIAVKAATQTLAVPDGIFAALIALMFVQAGQVAMQGGWVLWREPEQMRHVVASWRTSAQVGVLAALGSACWFTGFATAPVALVRTVGQVEVIFTLGFSRFYLGERAGRRDIAGLAMVCAGVALALAASIQ